MQKGAKTSINWKNTKTIQTERHEGKQTDIPTRDKRVAQQEQMRHNKTGEAKLPVKIRQETCKHRCRDQR